MENKNEDDENIVEITIPLCMCVGMSLGLIFDNLLLGIVIGFFGGTLLGLLTNTKE